MKIGIFGGCFNPPHQMHKDIAINLLKNNYLDKVIYVPTGNFYQKCNLASDIDRYNMLKIMLKDIQNVEVSDYEFGTFKYTYQTLNHFKKIYPNDDIYFICGSDNLKEIDEWKEYKYILNNFKLLVIKRNDDDIEKIIYNYHYFENNIIVANIPLNYISSTKIRKMLKNAVIKNITDTMLNENVLHYIKTKKLYNK